MKQSTRRIGQHTISRIQNPTLKKGVFMLSSEVGAYWEKNAPAWIALSRAGYDVYRDALNTPAFLQMLPDVGGLKGIDLGCGEGTNTRQIAIRGARMSAIDIAPSFIEAARAAERQDPQGVEYLIGNAAHLEFPDECFDFAVAFMSFMDMPDQTKALKEAHRVLVRGGFLQFSILHPCFVPPKRRTLRNSEGEVYAIEVADYFHRTNGDVETWSFGAAPEEERGRYAPFEVPRFHRTLSDWVGMIHEAGFQIESLHEPVADEETAKKYPEVADTRVTPLFLLLRVRKVSIT
ncbi:class I SAM-dependent methyltransferase [Ruegeria sp. EL01]|uniref:class I SAM-dependent methyltransferase n=1 Tax=Ruegeria sp. EL01 TaxID=2107578 RepID=UPI001C1F9649|nr:class I SAM-dependent methyltransferase [Ruegeria sp. EL01]